MASIERKPKNLNVKNMAYVEMVLSPKSIKVRKDVMVVEKVTGLMVMFKKCKGEHVPTRIKHDTVGKLRQAMNKETGDRVFSLFAISDTERAEVDLIERVQTVIKLEQENWNELAKNVQFYKMNGRKKAAEGKK